jgi:hypothetical protein
MTSNGAALKIRRNLRFHHAESSIIRSARTTIWY